MDEEFIMNILSPLLAKLPMFEDFFTWYFEEKTLYPVNIKQDEEKIFAGACNRQSHDCCVCLAEKVASQVCLEMMDPKNALHCHLSGADG